MPWPPQLSALLARADSRAAQALRWGLCGLRASLRAMREEVPLDPGCDDLRGILTELDALLEAPRPSGAADTAELPAVGLTSDAPRLLPLVQAAAADPRLREALRRRPLRDDSDPNIWNDIQCLLLRLPPAAAGEWRRRCLSVAEQAGARPDEARAAALPLGRDEAIYPGLTGTVEAPGLRSAVSAPADPRVSAPPAPDKDVRFLAGVTSACLWFVENDPQLHHCLASVFRFGLAPLAGDQRERYVAELLRLWGRVSAGAGKGPSPQGLKDRLDLDEALHSLVYQPPADPASWWGRLLAEARDTVFRERDRVVQAGYSAHLQSLSGIFADVNRLAPGSLEVDFGTPGEVAACLRLWARLEGEELKGRVLYRPPREDV
jgi:hypothetical protein